MAIGTNRSQGRSIAGGRKFLGSSAKGYQVGQDRSQALAAIAQRKAAAEAKGNDKEAATWAMIGAVVLGTAAGFAAPGAGFAVFSSNPADRAAAIQKLTPDQMDLIQQNPEKVMALLKLYQGQGG